MPFIDSKITVKLTPEKKDLIKTEFGKAVSVLNKPESFLMVGIEDGCDLWLAGEKLEKGAYVAVSLLGNSKSESYEKMTGIICDILQRELEIPGNAVYVTYHPVADWGWNGKNF